MPTFHLLFWTNWTPTWTTVIRVSGLVAWYLLNLEIMVGAMAASGVGRLAVSPTRKLVVHRAFLSWALVVAVAVHIATIVFSHYKGWGVNMVSGIGFGTLARNMGVLAAYLLLVVVLVGSLRHYLPRWAWNVLHRGLPLVALVAATIHGLGAGTDSRDPQIIYPAIVTLTVLGTIFIARGYARHARMIRARGRRHIQRRQYRVGRPDGHHYRKRY